MADAVPEPTYEEKMRVPPPPGVGGGTCWSTVYRCVKKKNDKKGILKAPQLALYLGPI